MLVHPQALECQVQRPWTLRSSISATVDNTARASVVGSDSDITETHVSGRSDVVGVVGGEVGSGMGRESGGGSSTTRAPDSSIVRPL